MEPEHDYVNKLIEAFKNALTESNPLQNLYMLVPVLTIHFTNYLLARKDKISKRTSHGAIISDDGFVFGVVYVLTVNSEVLQFEGLIWWDSFDCQMKVGAA